MITLSTVTVQSVYSRDQTLELVSNLVYRDSFDALAELFDSTGKPFTGTFKQEASLVLFPVQRGRIMPMPRIKVHFVERGDAVSVIMESSPNLNTTLHLVTFALFGLVMTYLSYPTYGVISSVTMVFPSLFIMIIRHLLLKEISRAVSIITSKIGSAQARDD